jgi:putative ABC transport system permease protein
LAPQGELIVIALPLGHIFSSLTRHKAGVFILACQMALTLAIVANVVFIITQRINLIARPSGIDEANLVIVDNRWVGPLSPAEAHVRTDADLATLRALPEVADAYADYSFPVAGPWASITALSLEPNQKTPTSLGEPYYADQHTLGTYGLRLIAGRNFDASDLQPGSQLDEPKSGPVIITQDFARKLFPGGQAVGKTVFMGDQSKIIVGMIADVEVPSVGTRTFAYRSVLLPVRLADVAGDFYIVRAKPGMAERLKNSLAKTLYDTSRLRMIDRKEGVQLFGALRSKAYLTDRGLVILLTAAAAILLLATAGGIIGTTTFWVESRRRELGMKRALGARRIDILAYVLAENFFIVMLGIVCGSIIALAANISLMHYLAMTQLPAAYITLTSLLILALGQCAALPPARRAARVSPAEAMRVVPG